MTRYMLDDPRVLTMFTNLNERIEKLQIANKELTRMMDQERFRIQRIIQNLQADERRTNEQLKKALQVADELIYLMYDSHVSMPMEMAQPSIDRHIRRVDSTDTSSFDNGEPDSDYDLDDLAEEK